MELDYIEVKQDERDKGVRRTYVKEKAYPAYDRIRKLHKESYEDMALDIEEENIKISEAKKFSVDERSIQRDIDDIRVFLDERRISWSTDARKVEYDRSRRGFVMTGEEGSLMSNSEILAVSKILLASRAFTKREIGSI